MRRVLVTFFTVAYLAPRTGPGQSSGFNLVKVEQMQLEQFSDRRQIQLVSSLLIHRFLLGPCQKFWFSRWGWGLRLWISNKNSANTYEIQRVVKYLCSFLVKLNLLYGLRREAYWLKRKNSVKLMHFSGEKNCFLNLLYLSFYPSPKLNDSTIEIFSLNIFNIAFIDIYYSLVFNMTFALFLIFLLS